MKDVFLKLEENLTTPQGKEQVARLQSQKNQFKGQYDVNNATVPRNEFRNKNGTLRQSVTGGSTINSALMVNNKIYVSNSGDSRCIIVEKVNNRVQVAFATKDHKPDNKEEKKRIEQAGGYVS